MPWRRKSYEVLPALSVRGPELRRSLRLVTIAWMYGIVWSVCVGGSSVPVFTQMLGFGQFAYGLLAAVPFLATLGQLVAAILIERSGLKKYQFVQCGTAHRLLWFAVAAIPFALPVPSPWAVGAMLVILTASAFLNALANPAWMTWMGDLIPRRIRGRYLARRALYTRPIQIVVVIALGLLLDAVTVPGAPETAARQRLLLRTICAIFALAAVFGATDILLFRRIREVVPTVDDDAQRGPAVRIDVPRPRRWTALSALRYVGACVATAVRQLLLEPLGDRVFRHYVGYGATITFAMAVPGYFIWLNGLQNLGYSKVGANVVFMVIGTALGLLGVRAWGTLIDRWGRRPALVLATCGTTVSILPWFFASRDVPNPKFAADLLNALALHAGHVAAWLGALFGQDWGGTWVWVDDATPLSAYLTGAVAAIVGGISWTGIHLAQMGVVLGFSDGHGRSKYIAASAVLISVGGMVGGLVGGTVAESLKFLGSDPIRVGPFLWNQWHATFLLSDLARFLSLLWLVRMPDPGARPVRDLMRTYGTSMYNSLATWLFYPLRVVGWGRRDDSRQPRRRSRRRL